MLFHEKYIPCKIHNCKLLKIYFMKKNFLHKLSAIVCLVALSLLAHVANAQYCTPTYFQGCVLSCEINDFTLNGESGTSITDLATGCSSSGTLPVTCYRDEHATM